MRVLAPTVVVVAVLALVGTQSGPATGEAGTSYPRALAKEGTLLTIDFSRGFAPAVPELSGSSERLFVERVSGLPPLRVIAGGYEAGTHYARVRWRKANLGPKAVVWISADFYLPSDFYERQESYLRLITLDNYNLEPDSTRRLGLAIYGYDHQARLLRMRSGVEEEELLRLPELLPTGRMFTLTLGLRLATNDGRGLSQVYVDGQLVGETASANLSSGKLADGRRPAYTRVSFGIDGAARQDTRTIEIRMGSLVVSTEPLAPSAAARLD